MAHSIQVRLFDIGATDRDISIESVDLAKLSEQQLLWIDLSAGTADEIVLVAGRLGWPEPLVHKLGDQGTTPELKTYGPAYYVRVVAVRHDGNLTFKGTVLTIVAGDNYVASFHAEPIQFINELRNRDFGDSDLGILSADSFTASLLDWHLCSYFEAVSIFEAADERLEVEILHNRHQRGLETLRELRKAASRLRRMLSAHRGVFSALARPDFRPTAEREANRHFLTVDTHFQRALDAVEATRDIVIGSFELFSSQTALRTNRVMRALTFATVLLGVLAVVAGILGMNFEAPFFETGLTGFVAAVLVMLLLAAIGLAIAKKRGWI
jgi:Mg2+ and Co2+ transporter CorA